MAPWDTRRVKLAERAKRIRINNKYNNKNNTVNVQIGLFCADYNIAAVLTVAHGAKCVVKISSLILFRRRLSTGVCRWPVGIRRWRPFSMSFLLARERVTTQRLLTGGVVERYLQYLLRWSRRVANCRRSRSQIIAINLPKTDKITTPLCVVVVVVVVVTRRAVLIRVARRVTHGPRESGHGHARILKR